MPNSHLADIAARSGVTVPTVSKVLNGRPDVSPATRARVLQLLEETGYERRGTRRKPGQPRTQADWVDLVVNPLGKSWAVEVLKGVSSAASDVGCEVVVTYPADDTLDDEWVARVIRRGTRGVVLERFALTNLQRDRLARAGIPTVTIDPGAEPLPGELSVGAANWAGGNSAAEHLVGLGHTRIAVIGGGTEMSSRARVDGFKSALKIANIDIPKKWDRSADWSRTGGHEEALNILADSDRPTAIFACSDRMAAGVLAAARELGINIPEQLSVIGFDDLPESQWLTPALTTVRQPVQEMGNTALQLILASAVGASLATNRVELATSLIERDSTSAPSGPKS